MAWNQQKNGFSQKSIWPILRSTADASIGSWQAHHREIQFPGFNTVSGEYSMIDLAAMQAAISEQGIDAWLLYDFRGMNILARRVLGLDGGAMLSRRWFYLIPAKGEPRKLVHRIEPAALDSLPGSKQHYMRWQELEAGVQSLVMGCKRVAMEYIPRNANPYVSRVDAGTIELVRSFGPEITSSGDLVQLFEACWDNEQWAMHQEAAKHTRSAYDAAWKFIADGVRSGAAIRETDVQQRILGHFKQHGLVCDHPPICAVNAHSGDPHYEPVAGKDAPIRENDFVLIDLWAKLDKPRAVYSDLTWTGFVGKEVPEKYQKIFQVVAGARDAAINRVRDAFAKREPLQGAHVDKAARDVIVQAGYGEFFVHRTGHSIGQEVHGNGANMDSLETREERRVLPRTCFSVEPGIYLKEFGIRSEVDVFVDANSHVHVTGGTPQTEVLAILR
jgi:Xaa-Pro aminopeptidase